MNSSTQRREGGCLCGSVRYAMDWPAALTVSCSCRNCQKQSGAPLSIVCVTARETLSRSGALNCFEDRSETGNRVERLFCPNCGSAVFTDTDAARSAGVIFVKAGTLDETADLKPTAHCWTQSAQGWIVFPQGDTIMQQQEGL